MHVEEPVRDPVPCVVSSRVVGTQLRDNVSKCRSVHSFGLDRELRENGLPCPDLVGRTGNVLPTRSRDTKGYSTTTEIQGKIHRSGTSTVSLLFLGRDGSS